MSRRMEWLAAGAFVATFAVGCLALRDALDGRTLFQAICAAVDFMAAGSLVTSYVEIRRRNNDRAKETH